MISEETQFLFIIKIADLIIYNTVNSKLPDNYIRTISIDNTGIKWIGTYQNGLAVFDGTNWTWSAISFSRTIYSLYATGSYVYVGAYAEILWSADYGDNFLLVFLQMYF